MDNPGTAPAAGNRGNGGPTSTVADSRGGTVARGRARGGLSALIPLLALVLLLFPGACADMADLMRLDVGLAKEFGQANVNLTNTHLTVTFPNSRFAGRPDEAETARKAAEYVRDHYPKYRSLDGITIAFQSHHQYGPVGYTSSQGSYDFTQGDLGPPRR